MYLFLGINGVMRRRNSDRTKFESECLQNLENILDNFRFVKIVISSTWRLHYSLETIKKRFTPSLRNLVVGATPNLLANSRYHEILVYLEKCKGKENAWLAIDDETNTFPLNCPIIQCDSQEGFDQNCAHLLEVILADKYAVESRLPSVSSTLGPIG